MDALPYLVTLATDQETQYLAQRLSDMETRLLGALSEPGVSVNLAALAETLTALRAWWEMERTADHGYEPFTRALLDTAERLFAAPPAPPLHCGVRGCTEAPTTGRSWLEPDGIGCPTLPLCERHLTGLHRSFEPEPASAPPLPPDLADALRAWYHSEPFSVRRLHEACDRLLPPEPAPPRCEVPGCGAFLDAAGGHTWRRPSALPPAAVCDRCYQWLKGATP